ncbi:MAG TPA: pirin family protein [Stellaceae bacterium]|nr:pirin family protein [Stellaceae bacterium]
MTAIQAAKPAEAHLREVTRMITGHKTSDGAGVSLTRIIGGPDLPELDPFLLLDEFGSDDPSAYIAGFPDHPHRGFETVTYMLAGHMRHRDNHGNEGDLGPGSVQWMTAGRGIVHSEMPLQENGLMRGFQLWVNLPARDKMTAPRYQDIPAAAIATVAREGAALRVIAGVTREGVRGPVGGIATEPLYLDVALAPDAAFDETVPAGHSAFCYVYEGDAEIAGTAVAQGHLAVLGDGDSIAARAGSDGARLILVAGRKLNETVARYGPFVMNTQAELRQAVADFQAGKF